MKNYFKLIIVLIMIPVGCNSGSNNPSTKSDSLRISNAHGKFQGMKNQIDEIENELVKYTLETRSIFPFGTQKDSMLIQLFHANGVPKKLAYTIFDDGGNSSGQMNVFFLKDNFTSGDGQEMRTVYTFDHRVFLYSTRENFFEECERSIALHKETMFAKELADVMQFFPKIKYCKINIEIDTSWPNVIVNKETDLREQPRYDSPIVERASLNSYLYYIGSGESRDTLNGHSWIWYRVRSKSGKQGWIFGHPSGISELNDENAP